MRELRCLFFDDDSKERTQCKEWIKYAWNKLQTHVPIKVTDTDSTEKAIKILQEAKKKLHLFVVDILVGTGKSKYPLGLSAITRAREDDRHLGIVALSIGNGVYGQKARDAGADEFISKRYIMENLKGNLFGKIMLNALIKHGHEPVASDLETLKLNYDDLQLMALIDTIDRKNIINFAVRILKKPCKEIKPTYIRSGLSGASILRVDCNLIISEGDIRGSEPRSLLLKMSKDRFSLTNELSRDTSSFPGNLFIPFIRNKPLLSGGWYAIGSKFQIEGRTFLDWLLDDKTSPEEVESTMHNLFLDKNSGLINVYKIKSTSEEERPNIALWKILTLSRKARILQVLDELSSLTKKYGPQDVFDKELIEDFIRSKRVGSIDEEKVPRGTIYHRSHGDLHARNILINTSGKPYLIDPANIGLMHWASDIARLTVDLLVSGWDHGDKSHEWNYMQEWYELTNALVSEKTLSVKGKNKSNINLQSALNWIKDNLSSIHENSPDTPKPKWEFKLALAIEFMRCAYRQQELPTPKRVLGLIAACHALREANVAFNKYQKK